MAPHLTSATDACFGEEVKRNRAEHESQAPRPLTLPTASIQEGASAFLRLLEQLPGRYAERLGDPLDDQDGGIACAALAAAQSERD
jgi:hypothetical protein